jgi:hypothetical protein
MINSETESLLTLAQAADGLPRRRRGRKSHVATLYRWATVGCRGIRLETIQVGATRCTSREALQRFFERLSSPGSAGSQPGVMTRSAVRRARDSERAGEELARLGA